MSGKMKTTVRTGKKRILVVDDRASDTLLVKLHLERTNHYLVNRTDGNSFVTLNLTDVPR
jgi:PleD family two-component response regulator